MEIIFKLKDKTGREIYLSKERWSHITTKHPEMNGIDKLEEIKQALTNPDFTVSHKFDDSKRNYYKYYKDKKRYLLIAVKYLNGTAHVSTAFITRKIIRR